MKNFILIILFSVSVVLTTFAVSPKSNKEKHDPELGTNPDSSRAVEILELYLEARENGEYKKCLEYVTDTFKSEFKNEYHTDFYDHFRNHSEELFKDYEILETVELSNIIIQVKIKSSIEGPGYIDEGLEEYLIEYSEDLKDWKITSWKIKYSE